MKKLIGVLTVLALTFLATMPSEARQSWNYTCIKASDCPDFRDCLVTGCVNGFCEYACWW